MRPFHLLLLSSLILSMATTAGCTHKFVDYPNGSDTGSYNGGDQVAYYRQEAAELRAAALYYAAEAQRSTESNQTSDRAQRYRNFAQKAWIQAYEADRRADESDGS